MIFSGWVEFFFGATVMTGLTVEAGIVVGNEVGMLVGTDVVGNDVGTDVGRLNDPLTAGAVVGVWHRYWIFSAVTLLKSQTCL
jgi:hypothetical protein